MMRRTVQTCLLHHTKESGQNHTSGFVRLLAVCFMGHEALPCVTQDYLYDRILTSMPVPCSISATFSTSVSPK